MTQRLRWYKPHGAGPEDDRRLTRWFDVGAEPELLEDDKGNTWELVHVKPRDTTLAVKQTITGFASVQLPRWYRYAPRHDAQGRCIFHSREEAEECAKRASDAGEHLLFDY